MDVGTFVTIFHEPINVIQLYHLHASSISISTCRIWELTWTNEICIEYPSGLNTSLLRFSKFKRIRKWRSDDRTINLAVCHRDINYQCLPFACDPSIWIIQDVILLSNKMEFQNALHWVIPTGLLLFLPKSLAYIRLLMQLCAK